GNVQLAARGDRDVGRPVEGRTAACDRLERAAVVARLGRRAAGRLELHQQLTLGGELLDAVGAVVDAPDGVVGRDGQAVGAVGKHALAPGADERAVRLVDEHLRALAGDQVDTVPRIDADADRVEPVRVSGGLFPALDDLVLQPLDGGHGAPSFLVDGDRIRL